MRLLIATLSLACLVAAAAATAGGPPVVNTTTRFNEEPFGGIGLNCASGNLAESNGLFSGVIRTLVKPDGSMHLSAHTRGTDRLDDLNPVPDGIPDATSTFVFNSNDTILPSGGQIHHFTGSGTLVVTATGEQRRFHVVMQVVLDASGNAKVDFFRLACN